MLAANSEVPDEYTLVTADFVPETDGVYYFAAHTVSPAEKFYLWVNDFFVGGLDSDAPAAVTDLKVVADAAVELKATVSFTAPTTTAKGAPLANVAYKVSRADVVVKEETFAAGAKVEFVAAAVPVPGNYEYTVVVATADGKNVGEKATATAYIGVGIPADPENVSLKSKENAIAFSWDAVTAPLHEGTIIKPENVKYGIYPIVFYEFMGTQIPYVGKSVPYASDLTTTNYDLEFPVDEGPHKYSYFGVTAKNDAGESPGAMSLLLVGAPYDLPVIETVAGGQLNYWWGLEVDDANHEAKGGVGPTTDDEIMFDAKVPGWITLQSGKIKATGAQNPMLSFEYNSANKIEVRAYSISNEVTTELVPTADFTKSEISLEAFKNDPWVRFDVKVIATEAGQAYLKNIVVMDLLDDNVKAFVTAPKKIEAGKKGDVVVTVRNEGKNVASGYAVKIYADSKMIAEFTADDTDDLEFLKTAQFVAPLETTIFDEAKDITVKAEVVYEADDKAADNVAETITTITVSPLTPVETVKATKAQDGVYISWTVKSADDVTIVTEDAEAYEVGIYPTGTMGPWKIVDRDENYTYGWNGINWAGSGKQFGVSVVNPAELGLDFRATSGNNVFMFFSGMSRDGAPLKNDDWLISPSLPTSGTISFKARAMTAQYGQEVLEVMASSTTNEPAAFTAVKSFNIDNETFKDFSVELPAGTKYFALHYVSMDVFALIVDDIQYPGTSAKPTGFNVYVDKAKVASVAADATSYKYAGELAAGEHTASVTAVYSAGESAPVTTVIDLVSGIKSVLDVQNDKVYTLDGVRVNSQKNLNPGVYVVNGRKAIIR